MERIRIKNKRIAAVGLAALVAVIAAAIAVLALRESTPSAELRFIEAGVLGVSAATREAELAVRCGADLEGTIVTVKVAREVDVRTLEPGTVLGAVLATPKNELLKVTPGGTGCEGDEAAAAVDALLQPTGGAAAAATPTTTSARKASTVRAGDLAPSIRPSFMTRTWTFGGDTNIDDGVLELDVERIAKLPLRFAPEARILMDERVRLVLGGARVVDAVGRPVARHLLEDATVRVTGSVLPEESWTFDEDGDIRPAVRADRVLVVRVDLND
jgi:hypothetical protein